MEYKGMERRECQRFKVPNANLAYETEKGLFTKKVTEEECPISEMSRGGVRYLCQNRLKMGREIMLDINIPGEKEPMKINGKVIWVSPYATMGYKYQIGVQYYPFLMKKGENPPETLERIILLEKKYTHE
jgi:Tfp pilus assembly protein PilZ